MKNKPINNDPTTTSQSQPNMKPSSYSNNTTGQNSTGADKLKARRVADSSDSVQPRQTPPHSENGGDAAPLNGSNARPLPQVYYEGATKDYYRRNNRGGYLRVNAQSISTYLKSIGYSPVKEEGQVVSELQQVTLEIQSHHNLDYVGPLAGYKAGFYHINSLHLLVTQSPTAVVPHPGEWPLIKQVGENLFGDIQWPYVLAWLKLSIAMVLTGCWQAGQAFVMCGQKQSGKNLFMQIILTLLGGRAADPYQFMTGATSFNSDMFGAELLLVEDKAESTNIQARRAFGAQIKNITVNEDQRHHRKYGDPQVLRPLWRIGISLNDDAERLLVLPPIDDDIDDKIMLLKVFKHPMPMPTHTGELKKAFENAWKAEIPAFAHFLQQWEIPAELQFDRFGVRAYHHPDLLSALEETTPQDRLLELIDTIIFDAPPYPAEWRGRASELERNLKSDGSLYVKEIERLLTHPNACGAYLGRLSKTHRDRVIMGSLNGRTVWTIRRSGPAKTFYKPLPSPTEFGRLKAHFESCGLKPRTGAALALNF